MASHVTWLSSIYWPLHFNNLQGVELRELAVTGILCIPLFSPFGKRTVRRLSASPCLVLPHWGYIIAKEYLKKIHITSQDEKEAPTTHGLSIWMLSFKACVHLVTQGSINNIYAKVLKPPLGFPMCAVSYVFHSIVVQFVAQKLSSAATILSTFCSLSVSTAPTAPTLCPCNRRIVFAVNHGCAPLLWVYFSASHQNQ